MGGVVMIPRLYEAKESNFEHNGLGLLVDSVIVIISSFISFLYGLQLKDIKKLSKFLDTYSKSNLVSQYAS